MFTASLIRKFNNIESQDAPLDQKICEFSTIIRIFSLNEYHKALIFYLSTKYKYFFFTSVQSKTAGNEPIGKIC